MRWKVVEGPLKSEVAEGPLKTEVVEGPLKSEDVEGPLKSEDVEGPLTSEVSVLSSALTSNNASQTGGALAVLELTEVAITDSVLSGTAVDGGGIHVGQCARSVSLNDTLFLPGTSAMRGGSMYLEFPHNATRLSLRNVTFNNSATTALGPHVFWEHHADTSHIQCSSDEWSVELAVPQCTSCSWPSDTALFVSTATSFLVVSAVGTGSWTPSAPIRVRSSEVITPPLTYLAEGAARSLHPKVLFSRRCGSQLTP
ncbi:hypothetical protein CYMTET_30417 [Cymbomonas tetramitiformis]|uniref:Uncharacterized protein n=1 Tax=Cymbomonas tetramitiformis TaxID=36881 RepID=A0AAE0KTY0_9CHLO|nr:hypothetical protein CYMTET_30417 [Cymbomonas tetramitiformis]